MTVEVNDTVDRYLVAGVGPYGYTFRIFDETELVVSALSLSGASTQLVLNSQFTVTDVDDEDGGTVSLTSDAAATYAGYTLDIRSVTAFEQPTQFQNNGKFLSRNVELALDRNTRQLQDLKRLVMATIRYPDTGMASGELSPIANYYGRYLYVNPSGVVEPAAAIANTTLTQALIAGLMFPQSAAEGIAGVTPTVFAYQPDPVADVRRYGWASANSAAANATAFNLAAAALQRISGIPGGTVQIPAGDHNCDPVPVPQCIEVKGASRRGTKITYSGSGVWATVGGLASSRTDGSSLSDMTVVLTHKDGKVARVLCGCYGKFADMYLEGAILASRTNVGITFDGGSTGAGSAFGNVVERVNFAHMQNGIQILTTGDQRSTQQAIRDCYFNGDVGSVGSASIGVYIAATCGDGTLIEGGNFEAMGKGISLAPGALMINVRASRFEANTKDVVIGTGAHPSNFRGLITDSVYNVTDPDGLAYFEDCIALLSPTTFQRWRRGRLSGDQGPRYLYRTQAVFAASSTATGTIPAGIAPDTSFDVWPVQVSGGTPLKYSHNKGSNTSTSFSISAESSNSNTVACWVVG